MMSESEKIVEFPDLNAIEEEAALWAARLDSRGEDGFDMAELKDWLAQSAQHRYAFERMAALLLGADMLDELNYLDDDSVASVRASRRGPFIRWAASAAAVLLVASAMTILQFMGDPVPTQSAAFATEVGMQRTVALADGSTMILNTNSEVAVNLTEDQRQITLLRGEVHFDVAHDVDRPFLVYARGGIVKAVGTAFTVFMHEKNVEVTVSEGVVAILPHDEKADEPEAAEIEALTPLAALTVGETAVFAEAVESVTRMSEDALDRKLMWRGGFVAYAGEPLSKVIEDVSRYTDIVIDIDGSALENLPIGGYFKVGEVEDMFEALEASFGLTVERISPTRVVLTRAS